MDSSIDFGTFFQTNVSPSLQFQVENNGKRVYTVFITSQLQKKSQGHFEFSPSKFELQPSQIISVYVTLKNPQVKNSIAEEFLFETITSSVSAARVVLFTTQVLADVLQPCLRWNKETVVFDVNYGDDYETKCSGFKRFVRSVKE
jgi:hypothetical protein